MSKQSKTRDFIISLIKRYLILCCLPVSAIFAATSGDTDIISSVVGIETPQTEAIRGQTESLAKNNTATDNFTKPSIVNSTTDKESKHWMMSNCLQTHNVYLRWSFVHEIESKRLLWQAKQEDYSLKMLGMETESLEDQIIDGNSLVKEELRIQKMEEERMKNIYTIRCYAKDVMELDKKQRKNTKKYINTFRASLNMLNKEIRKGKRELLTEKAFKLVSIGLCYIELGEIDKALKFYSEALQIYRQLFVDKQGVEPKRFAGLLDEYAQKVRFYGRAEDAIELYEEEICILTKLKEENDDVKDIDLAEKYQRLGEVYYCCSGMDKQKAVPYFEKALRIYEKEKMLFAIEEMETALKSLRIEGF